MFIAALFTIAKAWKQPKCPLTEEWRKKSGTYMQWTITQPLKRMNKCHLQHMDGPREWYAKSSREGEIL